MIFFISGWDDVGYNFLIGEDGRVYTGRGWQGVGAHAYGWNTLSYGICMIGTYFSHQPTHVALTAANNLIECGIKRVRHNIYLFNPLSFSRQITQFEFSPT